MIESFYMLDGKLERGLTSAAIREACQGKGSLWVNLQNASDEEMNEILEGIFEFHPLTIEDCRHASRYPKLDVLDGYTFAVLLSPKTTVPARAEFFMREVEIYLLPRVIVTAHRQELAAVRRLRDEIIKGEGALLARGTDMVLHHLMDTIVDRYLAAADAINDRSEELTRAAPQSRLPVLQEILDLKHSCKALGLIGQQIHEALSRLRSEAGELLQAGGAIYFSDLDDHLRRVLGLLELARDSLRDAQSLYLAAQSQRRNRLLRIALLILLLSSVLLAFMICYAHYQGRL